jgi:predicted nuclease of predicted toxin-antitoxin system
LKLLFDQNLSRKLVNRLADIFPNSNHVQFQTLNEADDSEIWEFAKTQEFCIVTQDADFAERSRLYGAPPKVIWLRCGNAPTSTIEGIFRAGVETVQQFMNSTSLDCLELY